MSRSQPGMEGILYSTKEVVVQRKAAQPSFNCALKRASEYLLLTFANHAETSNARFNSHAPFNQPATHPVVMQCPRPVRELGWHICIYDGRRVLEQPTRTI